MGVYVRMNTLCTWIVLPTLFFEMGFLKKYPDLPDSATWIRSPLGVSSLPPPDGIIDLCKHINFLPWCWPSYLLLVAVNFILAVTNTRQKQFKREQVYFGSQFKDTAHPRRRHGSRGVRLLILNPDWPVLSSFPLCSLWPQSMKWCCPH